MIQINLLSEKKKKAIPVPIGGIIMILWIVVNLGGLYYELPGVKNRARLH